MIRRLKLFWKLALIAALIPLSVGAGMAVALHGARQLEAEYDHLYGFMRIPIVALDEANTRRDALEGDLQELARPDLSPERRMLLVQRIREVDRAMATLAQYRKEWLTTLSADFPAGFESNTRAQAVIVRMISQLLLMGLLLSLAGILAAWGLSRMIVRPLERLIRITSRLSRGELETLKGEDGAQPDPHARDEVGTLLRTTWDLVGSTERMAVAASAIAQGDLAVRIEPRSEKDVLGNALSHLITRQKELMSGMRASAQMLVEATSKASSVARSVTSDASESAAHIYDILPGIVSRMDERLTETAEHYRQLSEWMLRGAQDAESGSQGVFQAVTAMKDMVASKASLLEELASQTSLLALNATLEAKRAGEHGRGFAVVAHEVHKLSEHSQKAAQGIGELAASGLDLAERSGQALGEQVSFIHETTALVQQVVGIGYQHARDMSQLHREIESLANKANQAMEASRLLEEAMAQLVQGAQELQGLAGPFHLEQGQAPS